MARIKDLPKPSPPRLWGFTREYSALRDLLDQSIASRGGKKFAPRPRIPGMDLRWQRKDTKLQDTVAMLTADT